MLTWPVLDHDAFSCGAGSGVRLYRTLVPTCRMARATMTTKRYHRPEQITTPQLDKNYQANDSDGKGLTHVSCMIPETRSSPSCPNKLAVRVLGRAEKSKGKIRLLVHPSSFGEMAPSNLHGYPRALSDNYKPNTRHRLPWHWTRQAGILVKHTVMAGRYLHELDPSLFRKSDSSKPLSLARSHSGYLITRHLGIAAIVSSGPWHGHGHDPLACLAR